VPVGASSAAPSGGPCPSSGGIPSLRAGQALPARQRDARATEGRSVAQTAQPDYPSRMLNKLPWPVILSEAKNLSSCIFE
jgi:hypothetical protein